MVAVLPLAALTVWALARRRRVTGTTPAWAWRKALAEVGIVYGTMPWVWMTMLPDRAGAVPVRVSLVPLRDLLTILAAGPLTATGQVVGDVLVKVAACGITHNELDWRRPGPACAHRGRRATQVRLMRTAADR
jgi:hypothetical protein